jgi:hypothetical protein
MWIFTVIYLDFFFSQILKKIKYLEINIAINNLAYLILYVITTIHAGADGRIAVGPSCKTLAVKFEALRTFAAARHAF